MSSGHEDWADKRQNFVSNISKIAKMNNGVQIVYDIPVGKTFYITSAYLQILNLNAAEQDCMMYISTDLGITYAQMITLSCIAGGQITLPQQYNMPYSVPSEYTIKIISPVVDCFVVGGITGFEIT